MQRKKKKKKSNLRKKMNSRASFSFLFFLVFTVYSSPQILADGDFRFSEPISVSPFSIALKNLQNHINYSFDNVQLLVRALTHASFSEENNKALSILGLSVIEASSTLDLLNRDMDISTKDLNRKISELINVEASCTVDGMSLGLEKVIRVSPKTNSSAPNVVCGAFRAIFGAVAVDGDSLDKAQTVYLGIQKRGTGKAVVM